MIRLLTALLLVCSASFADEPGDADEFLSNFYADFNSRNIERLSSVYFYPGAQAVFGEHVTVLSNQDDVRTMFSAILGGLESRGYHRSVVTNVSKIQLGEKYVFASVLLDRVMVDGKKLDTVCSSYSMLKVEQGWRFLAWVPTEPLQNSRCTRSVTVP
jgi:hypothetical protein